MRTSPAGVHGEEQDARVVHRPTLGERRLPPLVASVLPRAVEAAFLGPLHVLRHQLLGVLPAAADGDDARLRLRLCQRGQQQLSKRERRERVRRKIRLQPLRRLRPAPRRAQQRQQASAARKASCDKKRPRKRLRCPPRAAAPGREPQRSAAHASHLGFTRQPALLTSRCSGCPVASSASASAFVCDTLDRSATCSCTSLLSVAAMMSSRAFSPRSLLRQTRCSVAPRRARSFAVS